MRWELSDFTDSLTSVSPATASVYRRDVAALGDWADERGLEAPQGLTRRHLRSWLSWMVDEGYARRTVARKTSSVRRYFAWAVRRGLVDTDPTVAKHRPCTRRCSPEFSRTIT